MDNQTPTTAADSASSTAAATAIAAAATPPVFLGDEAALRAAAPQLADAISARLASWDVVAATIDSVDSDGATASLSEGRKGKIPQRAFGNPAPSAGQKLLLLLESDGPEFLLSHDKVERLRLWAAASLASEMGLLVEGTVVAKSSSGLSVDIGMRAFLPAKQSGVERGADLESLVGQKLAFGISKFDRRTGTVELARRALVQAERAERKRALVEKLREGAILEGVVKNLTDYGAFVDLGGMDGLLHISDMSWTRVKHARDVVSPGDEIRVQVLKYDAAAGKISLGLKQLEQDPFTVIATKYPAGTRVSGKITNVTDFGAFLELEPGVEGLIHVSEMSWSRIKHPSSAMKVGDTVDAQVLEVDTTARKIRLGTKQLQKNPWTLVEENYPIGTVIRSTVRSIVDYGLFVSMQEGIDGFVHVSDLSWTQRVRHPGDLYKVGDDIEVVVLNIDLENERISLGVKQAQENPWQLLADRHPHGSKFKGKVMRITDFGAFIEVEPGIEGLVHVSELRDDRVAHPGDVVQEGELVEVRVLDVDPETRKISLSMRALVAPDDYRAFMDNEKLGRASLGEVFGEQLAAVKKSDE